MFALTCNKVELLNLLNSMAVWLFHKRITFTAILSPGLNNFNNVVVNGKTFFCKKNN